MPSVGLDAKEMMNKAWSLLLWTCESGRRQWIRSLQYREMKRGRERSYLVFWERAKKGFLAEVMSKMRPGGHIRADQAKGQIVQWSPRLMHSGDYQGLQCGGKRLRRQARARMWGAHGAAEELGPHSSMQQGTVGAFYVEIWDDQISIFLFMSWLKGGEWIEGEALEEGRPEECGRGGVKELNEGRGNGGPDLFNSAGNVPPN